MSTNYTEKPIFVYEVKLPGWQSTISVRGFNETDAILQARMIWKVPTDADVTAKLAGVCDTAPTPGAIAEYIEKAEAVTLAGLVADLNAALPDNPAPAGKRGRKPLSIPLKTISDSLRATHSIKDTATELKCSRGYIYKVVGADNVRAILAGIAEFI